MPAGQLPFAAHLSASNIPSMRPRRFFCAPAWWLDWPPGLAAIARIRLLDVRCRWLLDARCSELLLLGEGKLYCKQWTGWSSRPL